MKLHVSASNDHHQVSAPIKKILYIYVGECWCRDLLNRCRNLMMAITGRNM